MKELPKALHNAVIDGLTMLLTLRLAGTPAADTVAATAQTWSRVLAHGKEWDEARDVMRFQTAFMRLAADCRYWPTPKDFADKLPPPDLVRIEYHYRPTPDELARGRENLKQIHKRIKSVLNAQKIH